MYDTGHCNHSQNTPWRGTWFDSNFSSERCRCLRLTRRWHQGNGVACDMDTNSDRTLFTSHTCMHRDTRISGTQYVRMHAIPPTNEWEARSLWSVCHSTEKVKLWERRIMHIFLSGESAFHLLSCVVMCGLSPPWWASVVDTVPTGDNVCLFSYTIPTSCTPPVMCWTYRHIYMYSMLVT